MSRSQLLHWTLFRPHLRWLELVLALSAKPIDRKRAVRRHLVGIAYKPIRKWRRSAVERGEVQKIPDLFPITGLDKFDRAYSTGGPVILVNSHFGGGRYLPLVLAQMGIKLLSLEATNVFTKKLPGNLSSFQLRGSFPARALYEGQKALREGKVLHLAADGFAGDSGFVLTFLGRRRRFAAGFAELAVNTRAIVLPVFAPIDEEGRVNFEFLDPLDSGSESICQSERVESLVRQYVRLLEQRWSHDPGNVHQQIGRKVLRLPVDQDLDNRATAKQTAYAF